MKLSELYGKIVIGDSGKKGYVLGVLMEKNSLAFLRCSDFEEGEFEIAATDILSFGKEIIFRDVEQSRKACKPLCLGKACFDECGRYLGYLKEVEIRGNKISRIKIAAKNYSADSVIFGDAIIVDKRRRLKENVISNGNVIFSSGQEVDDNLLRAAKNQGQYIQTTLKSL